MHRFDDLLAANERYVAGGGPQATESGRPTLHLAVVTCMDARIDVFAALGLQVGEAHVIRNAGGRVTDDVLRSLALSNHALGVDAVVVMQHTGCGLTNVTDEELQELTGADLDFHAIEDHRAALERDLEVLATTPYLADVVAIAAFVYDVHTGRVDEIARRLR